MIMNRTYPADNESAFAIAYRNWIIEGDASLAVYPAIELDEFASCASAILNTPVYSADERLRNFSDALRAFSC